MKRFFYTLAIFAALGPPVGGVVFAITTSVLGAVTGSANDSAANWILFILASAFLAYFVGLAPAASAGALYALAPSRLRNGAVAALAGAASAFAAMLFQRPSMLKDIVFSASYVLAGALAAVACGVLADRAARAEPESRTKRAQL